MSTTIDIDYDTKLIDKQELDIIINEVVSEYLEQKQDKITKSNLENNYYFQNLNKSLEVKLWK